MTSEPSEYAAITPARDEAENLRRLGESFVAQTLKPLRWIVVDDDSADETRAVVEALARKHPWITLVSSGATTYEGPLAAGRRGGRDIVAFHAGVAALGELPHVLVKVDADVSFDPAYFERLLAEFRLDASLGIAGGVCYENEDGRWLQRHVTTSHVRGATRAYRRSCFETVAPLEERLGWDGIDELKARVHGWSTRSIPHLRFLHHRPVGKRDGLVRPYMDQGETAHYMGYRPSYLVIRALFRSVREPAALAMVWGYLYAAIRAKPRYPDRAVRAHLREEQSLSRLPVRAREALGRERF